MPMTPPPAIAQSMLSMTSWRTRRPRVAPMALRMANSRWRAAPRASKKVRDIGAGDQQDQRDHGEEHVELRAGVALGDVASASARVEHDLLVRGMPDVFAR